MRRSTAARLRRPAVACSWLGLTVAWSLHAAAQSRAEDPNYDPDAEARARVQNSAAPYGAVREELGETRDAPPTPSPADDEAHLEGDALRLQVSDIVLRAWPPNPVVTFGLTAVYPFEVLGLGVGVAGYVGDFVRLSGSVSAGFNFVGVQGSSEAATGGLMEASVGFRLLAFDDRIGANVEGFDRLKRGELEPTKHHLFNAWLPATHALLLEAGMLAGGVPRARCIDNCELPDATDRSYTAVNPLLFYPEGGLRYVFFSSASSQKQPNVNRRWQVEAFFHAVLRPLGDTRGHTVTLYGDRIQKSPLGARGGLTVPVCGYHCASLELMTGYLPSPDTVTFSVGVGY